MSKKEKDQTKTTMNISLSKKAKKGVVRLVAARMRSGERTSMSAVVSEAIELLLKKEKEARAEARAGK
ncbi:MAG: hypothetical protein ACPG6R_10850 [Aequoribacter sp.]|uniref:hypothetical protein n=1 Tax=Aequoribacter sp. TaxID=2847771 RepID=UPI003C4DE12D